MNAEILTIEPVAWLLRGGLFLTGALLAGFVLRRRSARWRAFYWRSGMLLALLLAGTTLARWTQPLRWAPAVSASSPIAPTLSTDAVPEYVFPDSTQALETGSPTIQLSPENIAAPIRRTRAFPWRAAVWTIWGIGALVVLAQWGLSLLRRRRLAADATELDADDSWFGLLQEVAPHSRRPRLLRHPTLTVPCAWGIWQPTILLPAAAEQWPIEHRRLVLAHEWAHLRRGDPFWQSLSIIVLCLHWANPLAWVAIRKWRLAEEQAADDAALSYADPSSYAALLVACARSAPPQAQSSTSMTSQFSMAHPNTVPQRVERVLDATQDRSPPGFARCGACILALGGMAFACLNLTPALAAPEAGIPKITDEKTAEPKADSQASEGSPFGSTEAKPKRTGVEIGGSESIADKLRLFVIPKVAMEQVTIDEAVEFLREKSKELDTATTDPARKGINFILKLPAGGTAPKVASVNLSNVPMAEASRAIAEQAGLRMRVEPYAVIIANPDSDADLSTKMFRVPPDFLALSAGVGVESDGSLQPRAAAVDVLKQAGISFPEEASAFFSPATSTLTVRNTRSNLELVSQLVESIGVRLPKMINLRAEFYRLPKTEALSLVDELDTVLDANAAVKKLRADATGSEKIKLLAAPSLQTRSGQRARVQSGRRPPEKTSMSAFLSPQATTDFLDDFQGCRFEADPILGPDGYTLDVSAQFTYGAPPKAPGERSNVGVLSTSTTLYVGQTRLVGTLSGGEEDDSVILVFVKAALASYH